ncbi:hypothetical protein ACP70R_018844 [Stipagrostis hirtigluma subsp. patula]
MEAVDDHAVPPPDMPARVLRFLETNPRRDVTFELEDGDVDAHFRVFAMRSPKFNVANFGPLQLQGGGGGRLYVEIEDMKADVFEAVRRFVYTDETPAEVENLLAHCRAADRAAAGKKAGGSW